MAHALLKTRRPSKAIFGGFNRPQITHSPVELEGE
jgi:hypothetical protein